MQDLGFEGDLNIDGGFQRCVATWYFAVSTFVWNKIPLSSLLNMEAA
jgi:hypothetical protein